MEVAIISIIRWSIIQPHILNSHLYLYSLYFQPHPYHPLHYTIALDSWSETRHIRRPGHGLGISPLYLTFAGCLLLSALQRHAWLAQADHWKIILAYGFLVIGVHLRGFFSQANNKKSPSSNQWIQQFFFFFSFVFWQTGLLNRLPDSSASYSNQSKQNHYCQQPSPHWLSGFGLIFFIDRPLHFPSRYNVKAL